MSENSELPIGWSTASVGGVLRVRNGYAFKSGDYTIEGIPLIRQAELKERIVNLNEAKFLPKAFEVEYDAFLVRKGDLLIGMSGSLGKVARYEHEFPSLQNQRTGLLILTDAIDDRFAAMLMRYLEAAIVKKGKGIAVQNVSSKEIESERFPLPPLSEQRRIAARFEELETNLDAGVAALERAKANLKRYRAAVLKAAVEGQLTAAWRAVHPATEPASKLLARILAERRQKWEADQLAKFAAAGKEPPKNWKAKYVEPAAPDAAELPVLPPSWCWAKLDQLLCYLRNGYFQSPSGATSGTPILRINAVRPMKVDLGESRFLDELDAPVDDYFIENGDLLFTRYNGSVDLLGVAGMVRGCAERMLHPDKLIRVKLVGGEPMPPFVEIAANVGASRKHMAGRARTTAGQTGISGTDVREMPIPLPPLAEQEQIVSEVAQRLTEIEAAEIEVERGLVRAARLRQSILKQAFEGKLVAQDASDEPAAVLLARIQNQSKAGEQQALTEPVAPRKLPREVFLRRSSVVSYTVRRLSAQRSFGRTQLEKTLHLTQCHLGVDLGFQFQRYAAGPFDGDIYKLEYAAQKSGWFSTQKRAKFGVTYHPGPKIESMCKYAPAYLGAKQADFDRLLDHIAAMTTDDAELLATTYAAWNDLLIDGRAADDDAIIAEVHGWHEEKLKFKPSIIRDRIQWMRRNGYIPTGQGQRTMVVAKKTKLTTRRKRK